MADKRRRYRPSWTSLVQHQAVPPVFLSRQVGKYHCILESFSFFAVQCLVALGFKKNRLFYLQNLAHPWTIMAEFAIKDLASSGNPAIFQHQSPYSSWWPEMAVWNRNLMLNSTALKQALAFKINSKKVSHIPFTSLTSFALMLLFQPTKPASTPIDQNKFTKPLAYSNKARVIKWYGLKNLLHLVVLTLHRTGVQQTFNLPGRFLEILGLSTYLMGI